VVKQLSVDLKIEFPDMGLSPRNLWNMKRFYERYYQADTKLLQAVAVLPEIKMDTFTLAQRQIKSNNFDINS